VAPIGAKLSLQERRVNMLEDPRNAAEAWSPRIHFIPLVGPRYEEGLVSDVRVLILGESHYGSDPNEPRFGRGCTHHHFGGYLEGCDVTGETQFFQKLPKIVARNVAPTSEETALAWQRVSYANAVQSLLSGPSRSPSNDQFAAAGPALKEMVEKLKPDAILMLGRRLWNRIPAEVGVWSDEDPIEAEKVPRRIWLVPTGSGYARATWIYHPSRHTESIGSAIRVFDGLLQRCASGVPAAPVAA
jgi:hypothetical protein